MTAPFLPWNRAQLAGDSTGGPHHIPDELGPGLPGLAQALQRAGDADRADDDPAAVLNRRSDRRNAWEQLPHLARPAPLEHVVELSLKPLDGRDRGNGVAA